jgi:hypothetical protein
MLEEEGRHLRQAGQGRGVVMLEIACRTKVGEGGPEGLTAVADQAKFPMMHESVWHYLVAKMLPVFQHKDEFGID